VIGSHEFPHHEKGLLRLSIIDNRKGFTQNLRMISSTGLDNLKKVRLSLIGLLFSPSIRAADPVCGTNLLKNIPLVRKMMHGAKVRAGVVNIPITTLEKYVDPLPIPSVAIPSATNNGVSHYEISMLKLMHQFHRDLTPVEVWGYNGKYPGPTIEVTTNDPVEVNWSNSLPDQYPAWLPANPAIDGVVNQDVRSVVHLHGGMTPPESDGFPMAWYRPGKSLLDHYPNIGHDDGAILWYHDHAMGVTENNVYAGLAGFYLIRNLALDAALNLPSGPYEIPLLIQDRDIQTNSSPASLVFLGVPWRALPVVNGKVWPYLNVEPRRYRFRVLNGCTFRVVNLGLSSGQPIIQIGTDSGLLQAPVLLQNLRLAPAERADVILDFTAYAGQSNIVLTNDFPVPDATSHLTEFMQFRVAAKTTTPDTSSIPAVITTNHVPAATLALQSVQDRIVTIDLCFPDGTGQCEYLGGPFATNHNITALLGLHYFSDPVTETPHLDDVETWSFVNLSSDPHPMHIHLIDFKVLDRTPISSSNIDRYITDRREGHLQSIATYLDLDHRVSADPNEDGPKDVVYVGPYSVTRVVMKWEGYVGQYVYHCHILDHEDNEMMRPMEVLPARAQSILLPGQLALRYIDTPGVSALFQLGTSNGQPYRVQTSSDLSTWRTTTSFFGSQNPFYFSIPYLNRPTQQFFRVTTP
jgi:spore coat protein A